MYKGLLFHPTTLESEMQNAMQNAHEAEQSRKEADRLAYANIRTNDAQPVGEIAETIMSQLKNGGKGKI